MIGERTCDLRSIRALASPFLVRSCAHLPPRLAATDGLGDRAPRSLGDRGTQRVLLGSFAPRSGPSGSRAARPRS